MNKNFIIIILLALVILQIMDGDFSNPTVLDFVKFVLLAFAIMLNLWLLWRGKNDKR
jgi:Mn2+/Fe2+ NRAMP family transporter